MMMKIMKKCIHIARKEFFCFSMFAHLIYLVSWLAGLIFIDIQRTQKKFNW